MALTKYLFLLCAIFMVSVSLCFAEETGDKPAVVQDPVTAVVPDVDREDIAAPVHEEVADEEDDEEEEEEFGVERSETDEDYEDPVDSIRGYCSYYYCKYKKCCKGYYCDKHDYYKCKRRKCPNKCNRKKKCCKGYKCKWGYCVKKKRCSKKYCYKKKCCKHYYCNYHDYKCYYKY